MTDPYIPVDPPKRVPNKRYFYTSLRVPIDLMNQVNERVKGIPGMTRIWWILEALREKLEHDE